MQKILYKAYLRVIVTRPIESRFEYTSGRNKKLRIVRFCNKVAFCNNTKSNFATKHVAKLPARSNCEQNIPKQILKFIER